MKKALAPVVSLALSLLLISSAVAKPITFRGANYTNATTQTITVSAVFDPQPNVTYKLAFSTNVPEAAPACTAAGQSSPLTCSISDAPAGEWMAQLSAPVSHMDSTFSFQP